MQYTSVSGQRACLARRLHGKLTLDSCTLPPCTPLYSVPRPVATLVCNRDPIWVRAFSLPLRQGLWTFCQSTSRLMQCLLYCTHQWEKCSGVLHAPMGEVFSSVQSVEELGRRLSPFLGTAKAIQTVHCIHTQFSTVLHYVITQCTEVKVSVSPLHQTTLQCTLSCSPPVGLRPSLSM